MRFTQTDELLENLLNFLAEENRKKENLLFNTTHILRGNIDNEKIFEAIPFLTTFPALILSSGTITYPPQYGNCVREVILNITYVTHCCGNMEKEKESKRNWEELICTLAPPYGSTLIINNIPHIPGSGEILPYAPEYLVWNMDIITKELSVR